MIEAKSDQKIDLDNWDEEQLSQQSQVTIKKFNSNISDDPEVSEINAILSSYPIEDRINFVIDRNKGIIIDSRDGTVIHNFALEQLHRESVNCSTEKNGGTQKQVIKVQPYSIPILSQKIAAPQKNKSMKSAKSMKSQLSDDCVWDDYWQQSQKMHQKMLIGICQKDNKILNQLFNKKNNPMPLNVNYKSFDNWTPLHFASLHGNLFALDLLLSHPQVYINCLTNFKWSALHVATKNNKVETIKKLLDTNINPNFQDEDGNTALHYAVQLGYSEAVDILTKKAKDLNIRVPNNQGLLPKDLTSNHDILRILGEQVENAGIWSRGNKHIQRLLQKVNLNKKRAEEGQKTQDVIFKAQIQASNANKNGSSKKQNIAKMYQLLQQKKPVQRIGLDCFKFYKKIGEGAFGEVYIVKKNKEDQLLALKAIKKQKIFGTNLMRYIKTEKEVLSLINHPFIVHLNYAFQTQAYLFLVMDYCEGGDLAKFLEKNRRFDEKTVKKYAAQILLALEALHKERIIYRDLKPDNIVLDKKGHALLTDFGLSKKTTDINDINKSFCGTPAYLPLEIINKKGHNRMADWYQYGVVLYELHAGIPPFYAQTRQQLYQNVRTGIVRFPKGSSQAFRDLIKRLLAQNPQKRLGFHNDAQSIKQHRWFDDIDWTEVYEKKMQMPKIDNKIIIGDPIKTKFIEDRTDKYLIADWSFIAS